jgi:hypothetical protein
MNKPNPKNSYPIDRYYEWRIGAPLIVLNLWTRKIGRHVITENGKVIAIDPIDVALVSYILKLEERSASFKAKVEAKFYDGPDHAGLVEKTRTEDGLCWLDRNELLERLPILDFEERMLSNRLRKLERLDLIEREVKNIRVSGQVHGRIFVKMSALYREEEKRLNDVIRNYYGLEAL